MNGLRRSLWIFFVSRRYIGSARRSRRSAASVLSILGIAAGVATLITVLAVMNGFQLGTIEDILEVESYHLRVAGPFTPEAVSQIRGLPRVESAVPFVESEGLVRGYFSTFDAAVLRGVPEGVEGVDPGLVRTLHIVAGEFDLGGRGSVVVGAELARSLGVELGDEIRFVALSGATLQALQPKEATLTIKGIFRTGHLDYDRRWILISTESLSALVTDAPQPVLGIKIQDRFHDRRLLSRVQAIVAESASPTPRVESWREYNRAIFGALRVEKLFMTGLVGLVFVVVAFNIYQSQRRSIVERYEDIAILKAIGAGPRMLRGAFTVEGLILGLLGSVSGLIVGLLLSYNINEVFALTERAVNGFLAAGNVLLGRFVSGGRASFAIFSPAYFYISEIPTVLPFREALGIVLFAVGSATSAAYLASKRVGALRPATVLQYE